LSTQLHVSVNAAMTIIRLDTVYQPQQQWLKHVVDKLYTPHNIVLL